MTLHTLRTFFFRVAPVTVLSVACGGSGSPSGSTGPTSGYALTQPEPYPEHLTPGDSIRTLIVRSEDRTGTGPMRAGTTCYLTDLLFDVTSTTRVTPTTLDAASGCNLYTNATPESAYSSQQWICAGEVTVGTGVSSQGVGLCPMGAPGSFENPVPCADVNPPGTPLTAGNSGIPGAVLTDLNATVTLPSPVNITQPSTLSVTTWAPSGDLTVNWSSAGATSAEVRLDAQGTGASVTIVCTPTTSGVQTIPGALIDQANLRHRDSLLRVLSVHDTMVTAERGRAYRVSGATASSVLLQGLP